MAGIQDRLKVGDCSILIVEDDNSIRDVLKQLLELEGYRVITASDGSEGLKLLSIIKKPCLILLDFMMPVMNGLEFAQALAKDDRFSSIPVIVLSAYEDKAKAIPAKGFLKKPVDFEHLLRFVRHFCES